jgi:hypothetical protein
MDASNLDMDSFTVVKASDWEHYPQHIQKLSNTTYFSHSSYTQELSYFSFLYCFSYQTAKKDLEGGGVVLPGKVEENQINLKVIDHRAEN